MTVSQFVSKLDQFILNPILYVLFAAALIVFIWGLIEFLNGLASGETDKSSNGKRHMLWGLIGLFIMLTAVSIITLTIYTFGGCWNGQGTCSAGSGYYQSSPGAAF